MKALRLAHYGGPTEQLGAADAYDPPVTVQVFRTANALTSGTSNGGHDVRVDIHSSLLVLV